MSSPESRTRRRAIVRDSLGVGVATGVYGVSFGAISVAGGLSIAQTCLLSLVMFTGASQFALVGVLSSGGSALSSALTALLLGTRNTLYGLKLAGKLQLRGARRVLGSHLVIDESTAMSVLRETREEARLGFWVTGIAVFVGWNSFTFVGAVAGAQLGDPRTYGLDAAVGAAFLALLWPRLSDRGNQYVAVAAVAVALGLVPVATAGVPVLAAGGVALVAGVLTRRRADATQLPEGRP